MSEGCSLTKIILASGSGARREILRNAGLDFDVVPADIDEESVKDRMRLEGCSALETAQALADLKARKVSKVHTRALVIGADQMLECNGSWFDKPRSVDGARSQLMKLRGQKHELLSGITVAQCGKVMFRHGVTSGLTMRSFSESFLDSYLQSESQNVCKSVGGYRIEGFGIQLFSSVTGSYFDILGLPLLPLLDFLRTTEIIGD